MNGSEVKSYIFRGISVFFTVLIVIANVVTGFALIITSYAGNYSPVAKPIIGVLPMLVPILAPMMLALLIIDLIAWRRTAIFAGVCLLVCSPAILEVYPVHFGSKSLNGEEKERSWTLLSYNNYGFKDLTDTYPDDTNPGITYILKKDADVVCLQEVDSTFGPNAAKHIYQAQVDSLTDRYPYVMLKGHALCVLSKYKIEPLDITFKYHKGSGDIAAYRLHIGDKKVTLFNVHLRSFCLNDSNKQLYHDLTEFKSKRRIKEAKTELLGKLAAAARDRAMQTDTLIMNLKHFGGDNVVVCGDFNDVPGCYTMRQLKEQYMKDVYASIGLGYMNTYNDNRFYFCIDHVMWRGNFTPRSIERDKVLYSDHYPLFTTFVWNEK